VNTREAAKVLGFVDGELVTVRSVRAAWARGVRDVHPDLNQTVLPGTEASTRLSELSRARDLLLEELAALNGTCKMCGGTGKVRGRLGATQCQSCNGTGDKFR
jgi:DnaJ-class molecular chaperone